MPLNQTTGMMAAAAAATTAAKSSPPPRQTSPENLGEPIQQRVDSTASPEGNPLLDNHHSLHIDQITRNAAASLMKKHASLVESQTDVVEATEINRTNTNNNSTPIRITSTSQPTANTSMHQQAPPPTRSALQQQQQQQTEAAPSAPPFQLATAQILNTLSLMKIKNGNMTIDEMQTVFNQFDVFMNAHPMFGGARWQQLHKAVEVPTVPLTAQEQPRRDGVPTQTNISITRNPVPENFSRQTRPRLPPRPPPSAQQSRPAMQQQQRQQQQHAPGISSITPTAADSEAIAKATTAVRRELEQSPQQQFAQGQQQTSVAARQLLHALSQHHSSTGTTSSNDSFTLNFAPHPRSFPPNNANSVSVLASMRNKAGSTDLAASALVALAAKSPFPSRSLKASIANPTEAGKKSTVLGKRTADASDLMNQTQLQSLQDENRRHLRQRQTAADAQLASTSTQATKAAPSVEQQILDLLAYGMQNMQGAASAR